MAAPSSDSDPTDYGPPSPGSPRTPSPLAVRRQRRQEALARASEARRQEQERLAEQRELVEMRRHDRFMSMREFEQLRMYSNDTRSIEIQHAEDVAEFERLGGV